MQNKNKLAPTEYNNAMTQALSFQIANKGASIKENESFASAYDKVFHEVPQVKYLQQAQYLQNIVLPQIEAKRGNKSDMFVFYYGVFESLMYAIKLLDRDYSLRYRFTNEKMLNDYYRKKVVFYEEQLQQYTTIEDLLMKETAQDLTRKTM